MMETEIKKEPMWMKIETEKRKEEMEIKKKKMIEFFMERMRRPVKTIPIKILEDESTKIDHWKLNKRLETTGLVQQDSVTEDMAAMRRAREQRDKAGNSKSGPKDELEEEREDRELFQRSAEMAIEYWNRTEGDDLELVEVLSGNDFTIPPVAWLAHLTFMAKPKAVNNGESCELGFFAEIRDEDSDYKLGPGGRVTVCFQLNKDSSFGTCGYCDSYSKEVLHPDDGYFGCHKRDSSP